VNDRPCATVAAQLEKAALEGDTNDVAIALRMVLTLEGIEWQPKPDPAAPAAPIATGGKTGLSSP
jgi:hypothetical protein